MIFLAERMYLPNWGPVLWSSVLNMSCHNYIKGVHNRVVTFTRNLYSSHMFSQFVSHCQIPNLGWHVWALFPTRI